MRKRLLMSALLLSGGALADDGCTANDLAVLDTDSKQFTWAGQGRLNKRKEGAARTASAQCAAYPGDGALRVITYRAWVDGDPDRRHLLWRVLLAEADKPNTLAAATLNLREGRNLEFREGKEQPPLFHIDPANYPLNATTNAFAIRADIGRERYCAEVGRDQFLTLFVRQGEVLTPVLKHLPLQQTLVVEGERCSYDGFSKSAIGQGRLSLLDSQTNGYRDLKLETRAEYEVIDELRRERMGEQDTGQWELPFSTEPKGFDTTLKFDGQRYPVAWESLPNKEWWDPSAHKGEKR